MSFISGTFLAFLAASVVLYYAVPKRLQWIVLLAANGVFYLCGGGKTVVYLLLTSASTYGAGRILGRMNVVSAGLSKEEAAKRKQQKKAVVAVTLIVNFGMLFLLKYLGFTADLVHGFLGLFGVQWEYARPDFLLPLGVSFYIFQATGYVIDQYRGKYPPERNFARFLLFTSFFPQMVQGPISRYDSLGHPLSVPHDLSADNLKRGIQLAMWGYFKKMVIADRAAVVVSTFFADYTAYGGAMTFFSLLMYSINLYCDFSGGIDITRGAAKLFGIDLEENFARPVYAVSLADYWRRWHMTLGSWMRDYVFYPMSLSRGFAALGKWSRKKIGGRGGKILPAAVATFAVYFIIGMWHGANFRYVAYGIWNGSVISLSMLLQNTYGTWKKKLHIPENAPWWYAFQLLRTMTLVFIGRCITRAPRLLAGIEMLFKMANPAEARFSEILAGGMGNMGLSVGDLAVVAVFSLALFAVEFYEEKNGALLDRLDRQRGIVQWLAMVIPMVVILLFGIMRGSYISSEFIYKQY